MKELEYSIVNYLLINPERIPQATEVINKEAFTDKDARLCYIAMVKLYEESKEVDFFTINQYLKSSRINTLSENFQTEIETHFDTFDNNFNTHLETLQRASIRRQTQQIFRLNLQHDSHSEDEQVLDNIINKLNDLKSSSNKVKEETIESQLRDLDEEIEKIHSGELEPVVFGMHNLDRFFTFAFTDLVILAGRPGMGKTAFVISALEWFNHKGYNPVMVSLEMSAGQIYLRMIAQMMQISVQDIKARKFDINKYRECRDKVHTKLKYTTVFDKEFHIKQIESIIQKKSMQGCKVVMIDYLQLIEGGNGLNENQQIGDITRRLKKYAKKHDVGIILLSQLSRKVEERKDKRPMLSDLRASGSIEQDADSVLFLYREGYYNDMVDQNDAEIITAKNRHGATGFVNEKFIAFAGVFKNKLNG